MGAEPIHIFNMIVNVITIIFQRDHYLDKDKIIKEGCKDENKNV